MSLLLDLFLRAPRPTFVLGLLLGALVGLTTVHLALDIVG